MKALLMCGAVVGAAVLAPMACARGRESSDGPSGWAEARMERERRLAEARDAARDAHARVQAEAEAQARVRAEAEAQARSRQQEEQRKVAEEHRRQQDQAAAAQAAAAQAALPNCPAPDRETHPLISAGSDHKITFSLEQFTKGGKANLEGLGRAAVTVAEKLVTNNKLIDAAVMVGGSETCCTEGLAEKEYKEQKERENNFDKCREMRESKDRNTTESERSHIEREAIGEGKKTGREKPLP